MSELELSTRQLDALLYFKSKREILSSEYTERYKITERSARYDLVELVKKNLLIKQGDRKSTKYIFPKKVHQNKRQG